MNNDLMQDFIKKLQQEKSPAEVRTFLENLLKFQAAELYLLIIAVLRKEDLAEINKLQDEALAEEQLRYYFKLRSGTTPEDFVGKLSNSIAQEFLR